MAAQGRRTQSRAPRCAARRDAHAGVAVGERSQAARAARVSYDETNIRIVASFDGKITEADRESMSEVETEVYADFHQDRTVTCDVVRLDAPARIPRDGLWVYCRKEDGQPEDEPEQD